MAGSSKTALNVFFFLSAVTGFIVILFGERLIPEASILLPTGVVFLYAIVVSRVLSSCDDRSYGEHQVDSVYFLGFLFTLVSLVALFYRLHTSALSGAEVDYISRTFLYAGISITTSLAGVLCRNIVRSSYLKQHPDSTDELERTYEVLRTMADNFSSSYRETLESIKVFLSEREENNRALAVQEKHYVKTLESLSGTLEDFRIGLSVTGKGLSETASSLSGRLNEYTGAVEQLRRLCGQFSDSAERITVLAEGAPFDGVTEELTRFENGTRELNDVLDSLVEILELKVEKVG